MVIMVLWTFADRAFYVPNTEKPYVPFGMEFQLEEVTIPNGAASLAAWILDPATGGTKGTVVFCHGNAGNLENHFSFVDFLPLSGYRVLLFDYQGYGESTPNRPTRSSTLSDAHAALVYASQRWGKSWLMGHSLGASVAIVAAAERKEAILGLVASAPFTSYRAEARAALGGGTPFGLITWPLGFFVSRGQDPIDSVAAISPTPILFIHGENDEIIPAYMSLELYEKAGEPKERVVIPGAYHNEGWRELGPGYVEKVIGFLERAGG
jgi:hypothetical protein